MDINTGYWITVDSCRNYKNTSEKIQKTKEQKRDDIKMEIITKNSDIFKNN